MTQKIKNQKKTSVQVKKSNGIKVKSKNSSKPIFHSVFKFIDKNTFSIFCTLILLMVVVVGLYLLQNQQLKEKPKVTPMITNQTLTDSPPPISDTTIVTGKETESNSLNTILLILNILGGLILLIRLTYPNVQKIFAKNINFVSILAFVLFAVSTGLTVTNVNRYKIYLIVSILGMVLSIVTCFFHPKNKEINTDLDFQDRESVIVQNRKSVIL